MTRTSSRTLFGVGLGILVFAGISIYTDTDKLRTSLSGFQWSAFGWALALALFNYALRFCRWQLYLARTEIIVPRLRSALIFVSGFALSVTPGKIGEVIKSFLLRETDGIPISKSAPIVVAERVTDLVALILIAAVGVGLYGVAQGTVVAGVIVILVGLGVLSWPRAALGGIRLLTTPTWSRRFREPLRLFYAELKGLVLPAPLAWGTALAVMAWLAECLGFALVIAGFGGPEIPIVLAAAIYAATTIAGALSFLPGGLLVTEAGMTLLLTAQGAGEGDAAAATILTRLATLWFAVVLGLVALATLRRLAPAATNAAERQAAAQTVDKAPAVSGRKSEDQSILPP